MKGYEGFSCAVCAAALLLCGCGDRQPPTWAPDAVLAAENIEGDALDLAWTAASDDEEVALYRVFRGEVAVAIVNAGDELWAHVEDLTEFTEYTFAVVAEDAAGNASLPLDLVAKTADVTPPVFEEDCELTVDRVDAEDLGKGMTFAWCPATDNDHLDHYALKRYGEPVATLGEIEIIRDSRPFDGTYTVDACDPSGNCASLGPVSFTEERAWASAELHAQLLESSSILQALMGSSSESWSGLSDVFGDAGTLGDSELGGIGVLMAQDTRGIGGLGTVGTGAGGGGTAEGLGGLGTRGYGSGGGGVAVAGGRGTGYGSSYTAPSVSFDGGKPDALAAHVQRRLSRIERCFTTSEGDRAAGTLSIVLSADEEGSITIGGVTGVSDDTLLRCATNALRGRLAEAPGEKLSGTFKVRLDPGST